MNVLSAEFSRGAPGRRVVVAGAGPGGLATAMLAAAAGADVTVLERRDRVGGRTSSITEGGYTFDMGPTFFLYPEVLNEIFEACGRSLEDEVELKRFDPMYRLQFEDGGAFEATPDIERLKAEVARISPADAENVPAFIAENRSKFELSPILQRPFPGPRSIVAADMMRALRLFRPWLTFDQDLKRWFKDPKSGSPSRSSRSTWACRPSSVRRSSRSSRMSSTGTASSTRSAAATRSARPWPAWRATSAWTSA